MITVDTALRRGQVAVTIPALVTIACFIALCYFLSATNLAPNYLGAVGILLAPVVGWTYWSFAITKWRIWAFRNVDDVHELKAKAISENLIWPDGSIFERTEIRTKSEHETIKKLESRFDEPR